MYYHFCPTCPSCHEPHRSGSYLVRLRNDILQCSSCHANFYEGVDLLSCGKFGDTIGKVCEYNAGTELRGFKRIPVSYFKKFPILWKIQPNTIEEAYIKWACNSEHGRFLITWPWRVVKFIPLLILEYLLSKPDKCAVVIGDLHSLQSRKNEITAPSMCESFDNLIYFDDADIKTDYTSLPDEMKGFDGKILIKKGIITQCRIHKLYAKGTVSEYYCFDRLKKCVHDIEQEIQELYGGNSIRKIEAIRLNGNRESRICNRNGSININLYEIEFRAKMKYKPKWLWEVLTNSNKIKRAKFSIHSLTVDGRSEAVKPVDTEYKLYFISSECDPQLIFDIIRHVNPGIVAIQNADEFIMDRKFGGQKSRALSNYLKNSGDSLVLMFSTNPDLRYLYETLQEEGFLRRHGITPHTWDSDALIENIKDKWGKIQSDYPNPLSSLFKELKQGGKLPSIEYLAIESLDQINGFSEEICAIIGDNDAVRGDISKYFSDLKRSPLFIRGDYNKPEIFKRIGEFTGLDLTYDTIMNRIMERANDQTYEKLEDSIVSIYGGDKAECNPVLDKITERASDLLQQEANSVTVVVHGYDVKGTERIFRLKGFSQFIPERLFFCKWGALREREYALSNSIRHHVIATLPPSADYSIYYSGSKQFVFIGSKNNIEKIETIVKNRLTEFSSKPIYLLDETDQAPDILKDVLKTVQADSNEFLRSCSDEIILEDSEYKAKAGETPPIRVNVYYTISPGSYSYLITDINDQGIFIPTGTSLLVKDGYKLMEVTISTSKPLAELDKKLRHKEIILNRHGTYTSFRVIFTKSMMSYAQGIIFRKGGYEWEGFKNLFDDSVRWIKCLEAAVAKCAARNNMPTDERGQKLANYLSTLDLFAKDPAYIRSWWSDYEEVTTESGICRLYKVEHPKSIDDIRKIYAGIRAVLPDMTIDKQDAERSYIAAIFIQKLRRILLKEKRDDIDISLQNLYDSLDREKRIIIEQSLTFKANRLFYTKIKKDVTPFKVITNYADFADI